MTESAEIQRTVQSTRAYRYVDGVEEIWRGVVFLLLGGAFFFADALGRDYLYAATAIVIALTLTSRILAPRLSERITADRTGAVRWKGKSALFRGLLVALAVLLYVVLESLPGNRVIPLALALLGAGVLLFLHRRTGLRRFVIEAPVLAIAGLVALALPVTYAFGIVLTTFGAMWTLAGSLVLRTYLRTDPVREESR